ncbi:trihelix transcription factor ASIL1-like [Abrus precatorius]|uniref:Trihelix transcription factor ASIL1-like n=1 Tax=Abrus precatorius TaxID=3816 RepID=A0A8B8KKD5_ABRPR|nr:trihelix transcription factor ASIL1-like [Abrus precatorius]
MDSLAGAPPHIVAPLSSRPSPFPGREDCWSEDATFTLIDAWGERYLELNRGNLRQKHWQEVADAVNARHGHVSSKAHRTDVQCKNRIDTLKKKYKIEKARVSDAGDSATAWPFFLQLDFLIGDTFPAKKPSPPAITGNRWNTPPAKSPSWALVPVGPRSGTQKRPAGKATSPASVDNSYFRRNFSAFAAAEADSENSNGSKWSSESKKRRKRKREFGYRDVAEALERFGEIYERVEEAKQRQMVELEKQRMQFAKDLECQRMQLFMETQVRLQRINASKRSSAPG